MGGTTRWFKSLFGFTPRRDKDGHHDSGKFPKDHDIASLFPNPSVIPPNISAAEAAWLRSFFHDKEDEDREQSRRAIAVAVASAAAADAAAKAAASAAAVVRMTNCSRGGGGGGGSGRSGVPFGLSPKEKSAVKIQTMFRGYLARKALRTLKGLVKLQALVRGFLVRKRATAALRSIQALMRIQDAACLHRSRRISDNERSVHECDDQSRRSSGRFCEQPTPVHSSHRTPSIDSSPHTDSPKIVEVDGFVPRPKSSSSRRSTTSASMSESYHPIVSSPLTAQFSKSYDICYYNECYDNWDNDRLVRHPGYMAKMLSFRAKWRSQSAPRQRQRQRTSFLTNKAAAQYNSTAAAAAAAAAGTTQQGVKLRH